MPNKKTAKSTKQSTPNATRRLYTQGPAVERKINLTSGIIASAITLAVGLVVGLNWKPISSTLGRYLGGKNTPDSRFSQSIFER